MAINEKPLDINLATFLIPFEAWGHKAGTDLRQKLQSMIDSRSDIGRVRISLQGVKRIDVSFASAAILALVEHYRGIKPVCLIQLTDADVIANITAAAERMNVPVTAWNAEGAWVLGPLFPALRDAFTFALAHPQGCRATEFAKFAHISIANASSRFKRLCERGLLLRTAGAASSGGAEFVYRPVS